MLQYVAESSSLGSMDVWNHLWYPWESLYHVPMAFCSTGLIPSCPLVYLLRRGNFSFLTLRFFSCPRATVFDLKEKTRDNIFRKHCNTTRNYYMISVLSLKGRPEIFSLSLFFPPNYYTLNLSWDLSSRTKKADIFQAGEISEFIHIYCSRYMQINNHFFFFSATQHTVYIWFLLNSWFI